MKIKSNKGVSLITLSIAVIIMIIITGTLIYRAQDSVDVKELKNMYTDIEVLNDKVSNWYTNYGAIPGQNETNIYTKPEKIEEIREAKQLSPNDEGDYYIIDVKVLENTSLNYGRNKNKDDVYIINEQSHKIYYPKGIKSGEETYYTNDIENSEISLATELTISLFKILDKDNRESYTAGEWTNKSVLAEVHYPEGTNDEDKQFSFNEKGTETDIYTQYPETDASQRTKEDTGEYEVKAKVGETGKVVSKDVKIDKLRPTIENKGTNINEGNIELNLGLKDEGGSKLKELRYKFNDQNEFVKVTIPENDIAQDGTYEFSRTLETSNKFNTIKIEVEDNAGNKETKTIGQGTYVAQIISIDGISISSEDEDDYKFFSLKEALEKGNSEGDSYVIKMLGDTDEANIIAVDKEVTIDLAGCIISSNEATLLNKGKLTIIDSGKAEEENVSYGKVLSTGTASTIMNIKGAELTLGENDGTVTRNITIEATNNAITNDKDGTFNFYDGQIIGKPAIDGDITEKPRYYNPVSKQYEEREIVYLDVVSEAVARIGYNYYTTIQSAVDTVTSGIDNQTEIIMVNNATVTSEVIINETQNIKLNLDGYIVQASGNTYIIKNNGKLEITDKSKEKTGLIQNSTYRAILNNKELTISGGKITISAGVSNNYNIGIYNNTDTAILKINGGSLESSSNYVRLVYNSNGKVYVENGKLTASTSSGQAIFNAGSGYIEVNGGEILGGQYVICNSDSNDGMGTININRGTITATTSNTVYNGQKGTINISGGTIKGANNVINNLNDAIINITGGNIFTTNGSNTITATGNSTTTITGGNITSTNGNIISQSGNSNIYLEGVEFVTTKGNVIVSDGDIGAYLTINNCKIISESNYGIYQYQGSTIINIKGNTLIEGGISGICATAYRIGGTIEIGEKISEDATNEIPESTPTIIGKRDYGINFDSAKNIKIYDGTIKGPKAAIRGGVIKEIEKNCELLINTANGNEVLTIVPNFPILQIGDNTYYSLNEAIESINSNEETTITILKDFSIISPNISTIIPEGKNIVIDLDGHTITTTLKDTIINNGNLKITDNKQKGSFILDIKGQSSTNYYAGIKNESTAILTIDNKVKIIGKGGYANIIENTGTLNVTDVTLSERTAGLYYNYPNTYTYENIVYNNNGIINISNSTIETNGNGEKRYGIYNKTGTVNINSINAEGNGVATIHTAEGTINITGENTIKTSGIFLSASKETNTSEGSDVNIENATITRIAGSNHFISFSGRNITVKNSILTSTIYLLNIQRR